MDINETLLTEVRRLPHSTTASILDVRIGPFWTVVATTVGTGIASTLAGEARPHEGFPVKEAGSLHDKTPLELIELLRSASTIESAIGLATVNALLGHPRGTVTGEKALPILSERGHGRRVAMIGRFPFAEALRPWCDQLWVFEREHHLGPDVLSSEQIPDMMPRAEVVAITATTILNGTLAGIMQYVAADAWVMMLGPSTPMASCLFEYGFDVLCGTSVDQPDIVLRAASQGGTTKQICGVQRLSFWKPDGPSPAE